MVLASQCLGPQFFKNGQKHYFYGFQPPFSRKPNMMESSKFEPRFVFSAQKAFGYNGSHFVCITHHAWLCNLIKSVEVTLYLK